MLRVATTLRNGFSRVRNISQRSFSWRILYFGTDSTSLRALTELHKNPQLVSRLEVVTSCPKNSPKEKEVAEWCKENSVPCHPYTRPFQVPDGFDLGVVFSFGYLIPGRIIESFPKKMINIHPSLLPKYRGPAPAQHALLNDDTESGVAIIDLSTKTFDKGNILSMKKLPIGPTDTITTFLPDLENLAASMLIETLQNFDAQDQAKQPQGELATPSYARKLIPEDGNAAWKTSTALNIYCRWRALPLKMYTFFNGKRFQILSFERPGPPHPATKDIEVAEPGSFVYIKSAKKIFVKCLDGWIVATQFQVPTRQPIKAAHFANLIHIESGTTYQFEDSEPL